MKDLNDLIPEQASAGLCCSQIILAAGMEVYGIENPDLLKAAYGLCGGIHGGHSCGTLAGAACLVGLVCDPLEATRIIRELTDWFIETFTSAGCSDILAACPYLEEERCLSLVAQTAEKTLELIDEHCR